MIAAVPRVNVLGVGIHAVDLAQAVGLVLEAARAPGFTGYVTATGVHGVIESQDDEELKKIHNRSFLSVPDGIPMVWVGRARGHASMRQVAGADLMRTLMARSAASGERHFLWGGGAGVAEQLARALATSYPGVYVCGAVTPPFRPLSENEEAELVEVIAAARPHLLWVGLSTPKQERFMAGFLARHAARLRCAEQGLVLLGVGAAFDFLAGTRKEAPRLLRGSGVEWLYRMLADPKRLAGRYLRNNPRFAAGLCDQWLRPGRYELPR